jgi:hypothetical protein
MNRIARIALVALALMLPPAAFASIALPTVSLSNPAVVDDGTSFSVDIMISGVIAGSPLNAFEFDLVFDGSILTATSVVSGGFLVAPSFVVQATVGAVSIGFTEVTLLPTGAIGAGTLATVNFDAILPGVSVLDLQNVILAEPFGFEIDPEAVLDGSVTVVAAGPRPTAAIPEPSGLLLSAIGFLIVSARLRRQHR